MRLNCARAKVYRKNLIDKRVENVLNISVYWFAHFQEWKACLLACLSMSIKNKTCKKLIDKKVENVLNISVYWRGKKWSF